MIDRRFRWLPLSLTLAAPGFVAMPLTASAQDAAQVVPGVAVRYPALAAADTVVFMRSITRSGRDTSAGTRTVVSQVREGGAGGATLVVEQRFPAGGGEIVDTSIADLASLRAIAHTSHQPTKTMRFRFGAGAVDGTVAATAGDSVTRVHQELGGPIFDSNLLDLVAASLPLERGFAATVPFFIYERGGRVPMAVAVTARDTVIFSRLGTREVWIVSVAVPGAPATVWVDTKSRAVLRVRYDVTARAMSFTDERVTPL